MVYWERKKIMVYWERKNNGPQMGTHDPQGVRMTISRGLRTN